MSQEKIPYHLGYRVDDTTYHIVVPRSGAFLLDQWAIAMGVVDWNIANRKVIDFCEDHVQEGKLDSRVVPTHMLCQSLAVDFFHQVSRQSSTLI